MKYKAVIFDLDGVICHTDHLHFKAWKELADNLNIPFDWETNNRLRGVSRMESLNIILEKSEREFTEAEKEMLAEQKNALYKQFLDSMCAKDASEDVRHTLAALREKGIKTAIGSSSKNAPKILKQLEIAKLFDAICDGNHISNSKPHPEVFLKAVEYLNLPSKDCLVVEDAVSGIDAAVAGGFDSVAIGDASFYEKPVYKIAKLSELLSLI